MDAGLNIGILGPFEVSRDGAEAVALGGLRQRAVLAVLALSANEVVSTDRLVDQLWAEDPPATAVHTVQVFVSRLRSALASAGDRLVTRAPGYVLEVGVDELDADRCEHLYAQARAALAVHDAQLAAALLRDAEALWRGSSLADFTYEPFAQATIARLEELRVSCREERIEAELALGRHAGVVSELEALIRQQPLRERPRGQLMLALYRSGRQAEALAAFQHARRMLVEELAVEPSDALRDLEQAILRQDASLQAPLQTPATALSSRDASPGADEAVASPMLDRSPRIASPDQSPVAILRKTVTVLVGRFAGRGPSGGADPEMAQRLIGAAQEQARRVVSHHEGTFVPGVGGEVLGVFGLELAREDDGLRALRAADDLCTSVVALSTHEPGTLAVHVGVDTGEVVAEARAVQSSLFGEPLRGAAALAAAARDGEVLLSEATRCLAPDALKVEQASPQAAGWRLRQLIPGAASVRAKSGTPMVGRDDELAAVRAAFVRAAQSSNAQLLTVLGDAGLGKSRLADELVAHLADEATVLTGRCLSYGDGIAFWPLREALTQAAGGETRADIRGLLNGVDDADLVADIVAAALGLGTQESVGEQVPWAFRRLLEALARRRPLLLVVEDAHWAGPPLLDLLDYFIDWMTTAPVLLLCLARPELLDARPSWGGGRLRVSSLVLEPLSDEDATRLLRHHLGDASLTAAERTQILLKAEGNPLYVEQLLAMRTKDPRWDREPEIPATVQALIAARLDRLGPGERAFMERAAVIGREFGRDAVVELLPPEAQPSAGQHVNALIRRGLLRPDRSGQPGEEALRFHHILVRDIAYRGTTKALRTELHERFADWLERLGGHEEFVGYHLEQAFAYRRELDGLDSDVLALAARAGAPLATVGRRALSRGDANAAARLLRRAVDLFEPSGVQRPDVLLDLGIALSECGDFGGAEDALQAALEQARVERAEGLTARVLIELSYRRVLVDPSARVRQMVAVANEAIVVFTRLKDDAGTSRALIHLAHVHWIRCRCAKMEEVLERALTHAERGGDQRDRSHILRDLARAAVIGPLPVNAGIRRCHEILERADNDVTVTAVAEAMLAVLEAMDGHFDAARLRWRRSRRQLEEVGLSVTVATLQMYGAFVELMAGSPEAAEHELEQAYAVLTRIGERHRLPTIAALLARALLAQNRYDEAERYARITEETASQDDVVSQVIWRGTCGKILARRGEARRAQELVEIGVARADRTDFLLLQADALADRAEVFALLERPAEAMSDLQRAIALYECKGIRGSAGAARHIYGSLGPQHAPYDAGATHPV